MVKVNKPDLDKPLQLVLVNFEYIYILYPNLYIIIGKTVALRKLLFSVPRNVSFFNFWTSSGSTIKSIFVITDIRVT